MEDAKNTPRLWVLDDADVTAIKELMESLRMDVDASTVLLSDLRGQTLVESGTLALDQTTINLFLGRSMAVANRLTQMLDEEKSFDLYYHDGEKYDVYAALVIDDIILSLFFDHSKSSSRIGIAWLYMKRAIKTMREYLDTAMVIHEEAVGETIQDEPLAGSFDSGATEALFPPVPDLPTSSQHSQHSQMELPLRRLPAEPDVEPPPPTSPSPPKRLLTWEEAEALGLVPKKNS